MKVLNFGSLNIDYVYDVDHFVKKGETISSKGLGIFSGGKGLNQSIALCKAGANVYHAGSIGMDGVFLEELLHEVGVDTTYILKQESVRTGSAIIQNDKQGDNCIILYGGANQAITKAYIDTVLSGFSRGDWLVLQNEISEIPYIVAEAHKKGMKIMLNPSPMNEAIFAIPLDCIDCFILNEVEARALVAAAESDEQLLHQVKAKFTRAEIVLTLGERGAMYLGENGYVTQESYKVTAVDTTAAGDTFTGYYLAGKIQGLPEKEAMMRAAKAAAISVSRKGAAPSIPCNDEVLRFE